MFPPSSARVQFYLPALWWGLSRLSVGQGHTKKQNETVTSLLRTPQHELLPPCKPPPLPIWAPPTVYTSRPHVPAHFFSLSPLNKASFFTSAFFSSGELADFRRDLLPFVLYGETQYLTLG